MSQSTQEIRRTIKEVIVTRLELQTDASMISDDALLFGPSAVGGLELDSLAAIEIMVGMSAAFGCSFDEASPEAFQSVATLGDLVNARLQGERGDLHGE